MTDASQQDQVELNRLRWQCRRGMLELDLLLQHFVDCCAPDLDRAERHLLQALLEYPDQLLLTYLLGESAPADTRLAALVQRIREAMRSS